MSETATIKIQIGNRSYPLKVKDSDEALFREAEKLISERLKAYESAYSVRDPQDLIAMCALQMATESLQQKNSADLRQTKMKNEIADILMMMDDAVVQTSV